MAGASVPSDGYCMGQWNRDESNGLTESCLNYGISLQSSQTYVGLITDPL